MGVLDGVKVLEVAEHGFVPSAAAILAEWGADVVKVERPTGDPLRQIMAMGFVADTGDFNFLFEQFNRNKRGVAIDLRNDEGRAALDRLIEWADVYITNFLPSARNKLRLDPDDIWAVNPRCVYAIGSGQGLEVPTPTRVASTRSRTGRAAASRTCSRRRARRSSSRAARSATHRAARTSRAASRPRCSSASAPASRPSSTCRCSARRCGRCRTTSCRRRSSASNRRVTSRARASSSVLVGSYRTADERWISLNMLDPERHWEPTCRALGLDELVDNPSTRRPRGAPSASPSCTRSSSNASRRCRSPS